jgi:hypothetical protein
VAPPRTGPDLIWPDLSSQASGDRDRQAAEREELGAGAGRDFDGRSV